MGSGQQPVTQQTTQTRDPWIGAQPALNQVQGGASALYNSGQGYVPYAGQTQADINPYLSQGLAPMAELANQNLFGTADVRAGQGLATNMIQNQGLNAGLQQAASQYGDIYSRALGDQNPYLQDILNTNNRTIGDRVNASMSGAGRYGSGQHTDVMTRALAESANPILAQDYQQRQQLQMGATGALSDLYGQGLQRAGQWAQLAPQLDQAQYAPAQTLAGIGQYYQDRNQQQLADQIKLYNAQQSYPWEQLARYSAIASGAGGLGGTQVTSAPLQQPSLAQSGLGGAAAGAGIGSIFGAPGAAVGAGAGGLLGLLGR